MSSKNIQSEPREIRMEEEGLSISDTDPQQNSFTQKSPLSFQFTEI